MSKKNNTLKTETYNIDQIADNTVMRFVTPMLKSYDYAFKTAALDLKKEEKDELYARLSVELVLERDLTKNEQVTYLHDSNGIPDRFTLVSDCKEDCEYIEMFFAEDAVGADNGDENEGSDTDAKMDKSVEYFFSIFSDIKTKYVSMGLSYGREYGLKWFEKPEKEKKTSCLYNDAMFGRNQMIGELLMGRKLEKTEIALCECRKNNIKGIRVYQLREMPELKQRILMPYPVTWNSFVIKEATKFMESLLDEIEK